MKEKAPIAKTLLMSLVLLGLTTAVAAQDMPLTQVLIDGEDWEVVASGYRFTEGPAVDRAGNVYFVDVPSSKILKIEARQDKVTTFIENSGRASGLMFGPDDRLYACSNAERRIVAYDGQGKAETVAEGIGCNDLVVSSRGHIYCTDSRDKKVWLVAPDQKPRVVAEGFQPNGIILWSDEGTLVVTDNDEPHLWTYRVEVDGSLKYPERYYHPLQMPSKAERPGSDGMTVDADGRLYVATAAGVQMFDPTGRLGGTIAKPQPKFLSNVVLGGPKFDTLYATSADKVYRRKTKVRGTPDFLRK